MFKLVFDWMKIENLGIKSSNKAMSKNDKRAPDILESTTKLVNGHNEVDLLWKENADLPNNIWLAEKQLYQLNKKFSKNPELEQKDEETLEKDLKSGYVKKTIQVKEQPDEKISFLPHHPVTNENKPGKVRRVANASSVFQGQSLNSNLLNGPDLQSNLTGVILRFRENKIALSADIEQMFMQVKVAPEDRKFLRFLWNNDGRIETYEYTSHTLGATDSPCIASYALRKTARDNKKQFPEALKYVERNIYMDDLYISTNSFEGAQKILPGMRNDLSKGGFSLTKWNSSSPEFLNSIEPKIRLHPANALPQIQKVLGLPWNAALDCYVIESKLLQKIQITGNVTQRVLLKLAASLFDPLEFIAPLTIRLRKFLQATWNHGPKWDKPLLLDNIQDFSKLREELPAFKDVEIPRKFFLDKTISSIELHTFTDASEYAQSAVSYMRIEYSDRSISVKYVMGKARVAPIKRMTIPNLELQAAVCGAQFAQFIKEEPDIECSDFVFLV